GESGGTHAEIELPVAQELIVMAKRKHLGLACAHTGGPFSQGSGVVFAERERIEQLEPCALRLFAKARQRRQHPAGKNIMPNEIAAAAISRKELVANH